LVINIVANKRSESAKSLLILLSEEWLPSRISFKSTGEREKKAISEAELKPETNNNKQAKTRVIKASKEGGVTDIPLKISAMRHK
ncbi:hypothetical protein EZS27_030481, partial [termite gut metagenome]